MEVANKNEKVRFWMNWTLLSLGIIPLSYLLSLVVVLLVHGAFGFSQMEGGTYLSQTAMQVAGGAVLGLGTGIYQKNMMKQFFSIPASWIYALVAGFAATELVVCVILWILQINRYELRFIESKPLPEALFFACAGLLAGVLQWTILRKHFSGSGWWIVASTLGWGICILITLLSIWAFLAGALLYGAITGFVLMWLLKRREAVT